MKTKGEKISNRNKKATLGIRVPGSRRLGTKNSRPEERWRTKFSAPLRRGDYRSHVRKLDCQDGEAGEGGAVETVVQCEQAEAVHGCVGADQEIGEDAAGSGIALLPSAGHILPKGVAGRTPNGFAEVPFHCNPG